MRTAMPIQFAMPICVYRSAPSSTITNAKAMLRLAPAMLRSAMGVTARTVKRDWAKAKMPLRRALIE